MVWTQMWRLFPSEWIFYRHEWYTLLCCFLSFPSSRIFMLAWSVFWLGVHSAGVVDHPLLHQMHGVLLCPQILMVVLIRPATSVPVHHLVEVEHDLLLLVVIGLLSPAQMHGGQILGLHQHLEHCQQPILRWHHCVLAVQKQDLVAHSCLDLLNP